MASLEDALTQGGFDSSAFAAALAATTQSLVCVLDAEGHILVFNEACERATGFSRDEVLGRVATLVAAEAPPERVFMAVSEECARVLDGTACAIFRFEPEAGSGVVVGRYSRRPVHAFLIGDTVTLDENSAVGRVYLNGETVRIDKYDDIPGPVAEMMKSQRYRYTVASPIVVGGSCWGAVAVASSEEAEDLPAQSEARLRDFCELIAFAVASAQAREDVRASRARIVQAADEERRRLERNLHDGAQQRLVSLSIAIRLAQRRLAGDPEGTPKLLEAARRHVAEARPA